MKIGFIGLGIMGSRMAANLHDRGYELVVYNRSPQKTEPLVAAGAVAATNPTAVATQVEILITMLAHPKAVREAALGEGGFLRQLAAGTTWIDCSTVHPSFAREMAAAAQAQQVRFLDAPVAGSKPQAAAAELVFLVGGEAADIDRARPLLEAMGRKVAHIGPVGQGSAMKLVVNHLLGTSMLAFAESLALGTGLGLAQDDLLEALVGGPVAPPYLASKRQKLATGDYAPEFPLEWLHKDLQLVARAAYEVGVAMPTSAVTKEIYGLAARQGMNRQDFSAIYRLFTAGAVEPPSMV
ncbi:MAG: NAD(P)-dependent oxidoreductase [Cyanobacteria bacterium J06641_5]